MNPAEPRTYQVTVRVSVYDVEAAKKVGADAVGTFDATALPDVRRLGESALEGARLAATSILIPGALGVRAARAIRDLARRPEVTRAAAVAVAAARRAAVALEDAHASASARIVHEQHSARDE